MAAESDKLWIVVLVSWGLGNKAIHSIRAHISLEMKRKNIELGLLQLSSDEHRQRGEELWSKLNRVSCLGSKALSDPSKQAIGCVLDMHQPIRAARAVIEEGNPGVMILVEG